MPASDVLLRLDLRNSDSALSWPEHERRKRLGLRRLRNMLDADAEVVGDADDLEEAAEGDAGVSKDGSESQAPSKS
jgi:hypothetical protein